jgi:hypothetical protein
VFYVTNGIFFRKYVQLLQLRGIHPTFEW